MKVDCWSSSALRDVDQATEAAQQAGFHGITFGETFGDALLACGAVAQHTRELDLGTEVLIAFPRNPMITANAAWQIQDLSGGRLHLGLGSQVKGHIERRFSMDWSAPGPWLRDYVRALQDIWRSFQSGGPLQHESGHYKFSLMPPLFRPPPLDVPPPRIHLAAVNPYNARVAGEVADGIKVHRFHTLPYVRDVLLPSIRKGMSLRANGSAGQFETCFMAFVATGENAVEVRDRVEEIRKNIAFYGSTRTYGRVLEYSGYGHLIEPLHHLSLRGEWDAMPGLVPDDLVYEMAVVGTYDEVAQELQSRYGGLADRLSVGGWRWSPGGVEGWRAILEELRTLGASP